MNLRRPAVALCRICGVERVRTRGACDSCYKRAKRMHMEDQLLPSTQAKRSRRRRNYRLFEDQAPALEPLLCAQCGERPCNPTAPDPTKCLRCCSVALRL